MESNYYKSNIFYQCQYCIMKKQIDNYILEKKIGCGQFGDVFKGLNTLNQQPVAVKVIKRENLKGKLIELLQNEIKVLKACDNVNIIKLYDIKKTSNNFYLILQYCNEGDLHAYLKQRRILTESAAVKYFLEILNGFKTLVKNKIMHRDFKLANVLIHDGNIKIADFGFSKLLTNEDYASTILGSPLNMAPEVLAGNQYNNKADIWSIGTVFYELLFGRTPYIAANIVELLATIKSKSLEFPRNINKISQVTQDILKKMLVINPKERIQWVDLFNHPINNFFEEKLSNNSSNASNKSTSVSNIESQKKQNGLNLEEQSKSDKKNEPNQNHQNINQNSSPKQKKISQTETESNKQQQDKQNQEKSFKYNSKKLLHYRNLYLFLASVAQQTLSNIQIKFSDILGYFLIKKLFDLVQWLKKVIEGEKIIQELQNWSKFIKQKDYIQIRQCVLKQYTVFNTFHTNAFKKILKQKQKIRAYNENILFAIENQNPQINRDILLNKLLLTYAKQYILFLQKSSSSTKNIAKITKQWNHLDRILDCIDLQTTFKSCDFKQYNECNSNLPLQDLIKKVEQKLAARIKLIDSQ